MSVRRRRGPSRAIGPGRALPRRRESAAPVGEPTGGGHIRRLVMASVSMPSPSVRDELHARIARSGPEDMPEMIEAVREAELRCLQQLQQLNLRARAQRERTATDVSDWARKVQLIVTHGEVMGWDTRIRWLQDVRRYLEHELARAKTSCAPIR